MRVIIQKFGGTSVATAESRHLIAEHVSGAVSAGYLPVVVVSAMGRAGDPYATDTLIALAKDEYPGCDPREIDLIGSCGEIISSVLVCNALKSRGIDATAIAGSQIGIVTDDNYTNATICDVDPRVIRDRLESGKVTVVAGFQGMSQAGDITTLGRGGSDTSAVALGVALKAEVVEIYKDVDGIKTADPRLVPSARTIAHLTYDEACHTATEGAKVIHLRAVEMARRHDMPIRIKSTFSGSGGTLVACDKVYWSQAAPAGTVSGVTYIGGLCLVSVFSRNGHRAGHAGIFRSLADAGVGIDMVAMMPEACSFAVTREGVDLAESIIAGNGEELRVTRDCAKVSVVGWAVQGDPKIMAGVAQTLSESGVELLHTSSSHVTISCLIHSRDLEVAMCALHSRFGLDAADYA